MKIIYLVILNEFEYYHKYVYRLKNISFFIRTLNDDNNIII